jgi:hypothetical protein
MIADYLQAQILFALPFGICTEGDRFLNYLAFVALQTTQFTLAWVNADKGYKEARNAAKQFAFLNAGIDEAKERLPGESYEAYLTRESRFGQWMKDKGYELGEYTWTNKAGKQNSFTVNVDAPDFPGLIPTPGVLAGFYMDWFPPCAPCGDCCAGCAAALLAYGNCLAAIGAPISGVILPTTEACPPPEECCPCFALQKVELFGGIIHKVAAILPSTAICLPASTSFVFNWVFYPVPIAFIGGIVADNPKISVATTRFEANTDLGLWEMKYGNISSGANAEAKGGSIGPIPKSSYESYLISGGY